jgi:glycerol uptake facilitator-like aquaporin
VAHLGATLPAGAGWQSFALVALLTFLLMFLIMAVATDTRAVGQAAALAIGATVGLCALFAGPISGASMNRARSLGLAVVSATTAARQEADHAEHLREEREPVLHGVPRAIS